MAKSKKKKKKKKNMLRCYTNILNISNQCENIVKYNVKTNDKTIYRNQYSGIKWFFLIHV